ncbi:hypothetical protein NG99_21355 [Erwinia typographi]|uniref:Prophage protein n=1 Tax=Erwinia typographi TaxID=371042 RepID=A0A0A3YS03_9GAMM|nr:hypothetical protein [Erwinia typographi]KGT88309.1 hypothetical protein NG99_21355 [Erwinia typographi]
MHKQTFEAICHAENARALNLQAIAVLDMWMDTLTNHDEYEANKVAAIHTLIHAALEHIQKATEVRHVA